MNTTSKDGTPVGGGEILEFIEKLRNLNTKAPYLDNGLVMQFSLMTVIKLVIILIILGLMCVAILKVFNIKSIFKGKGISRELDYMDKVKQHDLSILRANKLMYSITKFIGETPFTQSTADKDYWQYNINRAGIKIPGGSRMMKAEELHALIQFCTGCMLLVECLLLIFVNQILGWVLIITTIIMSSMMPMMIIRTIVTAKDAEIKENFSDYYLMLHYVLIASAKTPLAGIMKSYAKTTSSAEMQRYIDSCVHYIDTYGEYEATRYIARDYREIPEVGKLMRLIRQSNEGGNVEPELIGFRTELLRERHYALEKRMNKLIAKAKASFMILMPILVQAVISAMAIYISDLGLIKTLIAM